MRVQQQRLCILDNVAAVAVVTGLIRQAARGMYNAVYKTRIATFPLVHNSTFPALFRFFPTYFPETLLAVS